MASFQNVLQKVIDQNPSGIVLNPVFNTVSHQVINQCDIKGIPYVFIDVNLEDTKKLGYFGQDAHQSGRVAAKLMLQGLSGKANILIIKQSNKKIFSQHIESRIEGFNQYLSENTSINKINLSTIEIDLLDANEPAQSLKKAWHKLNSIDAVFVPNSRVFLVADFIESVNIQKPMVIGFDLLDRNVTHMRQGNISYLLCQKPEVQAYKAIWSLFHFLASKKKMPKTNYSPIEIIMNENLDYYYEQTI
jgi:LacI family transcriptional regulator